MTFESRTNLGMSRDTAVTQAYLANLAKEARRDIFQVASDMGLPRKFAAYQWSKGLDRDKIDSKYRKLINSLGCVFLDSDEYPKILQERVPRFPEKDVSFLKLVFEVRCYLITNAISKLAIQGYHADYVGVPYLDEPHLFHNMIVGQNVSRYIKYSNRGVLIEGCDLDAYKDLGLLDEVSDLREQSKGLSDHFSTDYYFPDHSHSSGAEDGGDDGSRDSAVSFSDLFDFE